jgi:hypothetical protein
MGRDQLDDRTHQEITRLCQEGDRLVDRGDDAAALDRYYAAWDLVPADKENWEAATWILAAVGEVYFRHRKHDKALHSFQMAVRCPGGLGNPFIHLRLGEIRFDLGEFPAAGDELTRAYMGGGEEIFANEDRKYLDYLHTILLPPPGR